MQKNPVTCANLPAIWCCSCCWWHPDPCQMVSWALDHLNNQHCHLGCMGLGTQMMNHWKSKSEMFRTKFYISALVFFSVMLFMLLQLSKQYTVRTNDFIKIHLINHHPQQDFILYHCLCGYEHWSLIKPTMWNLEPKIITRLKLQLNMNTMIFPLPLRLNFWD
jgi:hypothetical protein